MAILEIHITGQDYVKTGEYATGVGNEILRLARFSILDRADAARQIHGKMTTSSRRATDDRLAEIEKIMKKGEELLLTDPQSAIEILAEAKRKLRGVMDNLSLNQKIRKTYFDTQMLLARSHLDNNNEGKSSELLEEIIGLFGDETELGEGDYHPRLVELYKVALRRFAKMEKGRVLVRTLPAGAEILIQGKPRTKASPATYDGLYPGMVTIQARKGGRESMIHRVKVEANSTVELTIDIDYENSLAFDNAGEAQRFGFVFKDAGVMKRSLPAFASRIGKVLSVDYVLAVGLVDQSGRTHLEGYLINTASGKVERTERLYTKANVVSKNRVEQLAMAMSNMGYMVEVNYKPWFTNWIGWVGVGVGVTGLAMGSAFYSQYNGNIDDLNSEKSKLIQETVHKPNAEKNRALAVTGFIISAVGIGAGVAAFLYLQEEDTEVDQALAPSLRLQAIAPMVSDDAQGVAASFSF